MKTHDRKRIEIVAADGFAPAEIEKIQHTLENALDEAGTRPAVAVRLVRIQGKPSPGEGNRIEVETVREEPDEDVFEEALQYVEAL